MSDLFLIHYWGRDEKLWNPNPTPDYRRDGYYWWSSKESRDAALNDLRKQNLLVVTDTADGDSAIHRCVGKFVAEFEGKQYPYDYEFGYGCEVGLADYMFNEGNYACDDNRSIFLHQRYPEFPEIHECGDRIRHISEEFVLVRDDPREA